MSVSYLKLLKKLPASHVFTCDPAIFDVRWFDVVLSRQVVVHESQHLAAPAFPALRLLPTVSDQGLYNDHMQTCQQDDHHLRRHQKHRHC